MEAGGTLFWMVRLGTPKRRQVKTPSYAMSLEPGGEVPTRYNSMAVLSLSRVMGSLGLDVITQGEIMKKEEFKKAQGRVSLGPGYGLTVRAQRRSFLNFQSPADPPKAFSAWAGNLRTS